jgi:hypothetical protein
MKRRMLFVLSLFALSAMIVTACGAKGSTGASDGSNKIGDAVEVQDKNLVVTMDDGAVTSNKIVTTFTIENKGTTDFAIDPKTTFVATATSGDEKVPLTVDLECGSKLIKGPVPAGGKITGDMCWRGDPTKTWPNDAVIVFGGAPGDPGVPTWKLSAPQ